MSLPTSLLNLFTLKMGAIRVFGLQTCSDKIKFFFFFGELESDPSNRRPARRREKCGRLFPRGGIPETWDPRGASLASANAAPSAPAPRERRKEEEVAPLGPDGWGATEGPRLLRPPRGAFGASTPTDLARRSFPGTKARGEESTPASPEG